MVGYYFYTYPKKGRFLQLNSQEFKRYAPVELCDLSPDASSAQEGLFDLDDYYVALEQACGKRARVLAENLVAPSNPCIAGFIIAESKKKLEIRKQASNRSPSARRKLPRGGGAHHPIRITPTLIGNAMGLGAWEVYPEMRRIREFTKAWLMEHGLASAERLTV